LQDVNEEKTIEGQRYIKTNKVCRHCGQAVWWQKDKGKMGGHAPDWCPDKAECQAAREEHFKEERRKYCRQRNARLRNAEKIFVSEGLRRCRGVENDEGRFIHHPECTGWIPKTSANRLLSPACHRLNSRRRAYGEGELYGVLFGKAMR